MDLGNIYEISKLEVWYFLFLFFWLFTKCGVIGGYSECTCVSAATATWSESTQNSKLSACAKKKFTQKYYNTLSLSLSVHANTKKNNSSLRTDLFGYFLAYRKYSGLFYNKKMKINGGIFLFLISGNIGTYQWSFHSYQH